MLFNQTTRIMMITLKAKTTAKTTARPATKQQFKLYPQPQLPMKYELQHHCLQNGKKTTEEGALIVSILPGICPQLRT